MRRAQVDGLLGRQVVHGQVDVHRRVHPGAVHRHVGQIGHHGDPEVALGPQLAERLAGERVGGDDGRGVVVGDAAKVRPQLTKLGYPVEVIEAR